MDLTEEGVGRFDGFSQWEFVKSMGFHKIAGCAAVIRDMLSYLPNTVMLCDTHEGTAVCGPRGPDQPRTGPDRPRPDP